MFSSVDLSSCSRYIYSFLLTEREADFFLHVLEQFYNIVWRFFQNDQSLFRDSLFNCGDIEKDIASGINFYFK